MFCFIIYLLLSVIQNWREWTHFGNICWWLCETTVRDDVVSCDAGVSLPGSRWDRLAKMADSQSSGLGEEKEKEKEDSEKDKKAATAEKNKEKDILTEALRLNNKNGGSKAKKRNLSGES